MTNTPLGPQAAGVLAPIEEEILAEFDLPHQNRRGPVEIAIVRELAAGDVPALVARTVVERSGILRIKYSHHQAARLIAEGYTGAYVSLMTGYTPEYLRILGRDPAFEELLAYYATQREQVFVNILERMRNVGLSALDELTHRLESEPAGWSRRELMELAELMLVNPAMKAFADARGNAYGGAVGGVGGVQVNVTFVEATPPGGKTIEGTSS